MVQGRKLSLVGAAENIIVEVRSIAQVLEPHDVRETAALSWQSRALAVLGPLVEAHGDVTMRNLHRALCINARDLERMNVSEDVEHASLFTVAEAV